MESRTRTRWWPALAPIALLVVATVAVITVRGPGIVVGLVLGAALFLPLERLFALRRQRVLRPGLVTDLTHFVTNGALTAVLTVGVVVVAATPFLWLRRADVEGHLPRSVTIPLAVVVVVVANYWAHRLTHRVPVLWRFHAVHHSIEQMDWVAAARLHPFDAAVTQACTILPLVILGYDAGAAGGVAVVITVLAIFQHANVRLRFPGVRWVVNTPEWHHWHHARDADARDVNFGLPVVDRIFGTAHLPRDARPSAFGTDTPVPATGYLAQLASPFRRTRRARAFVDAGSSSSGSPGAADRDGRTGIPR